jgi:hypothetical protein
METTWLVPPDILLPALKLKNSKGREIGSQSLVAFFAACAGPDEDRTKMWHYERGSKVHVLGFTKCRQEPVKVASQNVAALVCLLLIPAPAGLIASRIGVV